MIRFLFIIMVLLDLDSTPGNLTVATSGGRGENFVSNRLKCITH
jgi:hypothetical protein